MSSIQLRLHLSALYAARGMLEAAKSIYADMIASGIVQEDILYQYAVLCAKTKESDKAEEILKKIIESNPDFLLAYKDLAIIYMTRKLFDRAQDYFDKALKIDPNNQLLVFEYANYNYLLCDYEKAKKYYNKLLKEPIIPCYMLVSIALNYIAIQDYKKAKDVLIRAIALEPRNVSVLFHLGQVYFIEKSFENAKQLLEDAYNIAPNHEIASLLGQIYMELGQYNEAFILFNLVKLNFPTNLSVLMNLAKCKFLQGDKEQAKKYVQKVLDILPEHEEAQQMLEEINK